MNDYDKQKLRFIKENTNPFVLKKNLEKKLRKIFKLKAKLDEKTKTASSVTSNCEATTSLAGPVR